MKHFRIILAMALMAPLSACAANPAVVTAQVAGTAESGYQAFVIAEENLVAAGKLDSATFHAHETAAYNYLLAVRAGQMTVDAFTAQIAVLTAGEPK